MIKVRTRKPCRRKSANVRIRQAVAVLTSEPKIRRLLEVRFTSWGVFYLVEIKPCKTITNLRRYHRSSTVRRYAPNYLAMSGVVS